MSDDDKVTLDALYGEVSVNVEVSIGNAVLPMRELLKMRDGGIVPSNKVVGEPVDLYVKGRLMARGEVVVVNESYGVRVTEIISVDAGAPPEIDAGERTQRILFPDSASGESSTDNE